MSILTEPLPTDLTVCGARFPICADFRVMLQIDALYETGNGDAADGLAAIRLFYGGRVPPDLSAAADRMLWFLRCGTAASNEEAARRTACRRDFSFTYDAPLIYAAFLDQYGFDLIGMDFLHWWAFCALLDGLRENHRFCEVRRCRSIDLSTIKNEELRRYYREMKRRYALPCRQDAALEQIADVLMGNGDLHTLQMNRAKKEGTFHGG